MRKFMHNNVAVKYKSIIVWIVDYDYHTKLYTIEDKQGFKLKAQEEELRWLND